jgi:DNA-binding NarL/FixJ family response regulator
MGAAPPAAVIRILVVEAHRLFAEAMRTTLSTDPRLEIVGLAFDADEAVQLATDLSPDVVVIDVDLPAAQGADAVRRICEADPSTHLLALIGPASVDESALAHHGAVGFIRKDRSAAELVETIAEVASMVLAFSGTGSTVTR